MIIDASSIFKLINQKRVEPLFDSKTIDLAFYEVGNVIWKHRSLLQEIDKERQQEYFEMLERIEEQIEKVRPERRKVMETAPEKEITFYDAAYLYSAEKTGEPLITEDRDLHQKSGKIEVKTIDSI